MLILEEKNCVRIVFRKKNRVMQVIFKGYKIVTLFSVYKIQYI